MSMYSISLYLWLRISRWQTADYTRSDLSIRSLERVRKWLSQRLQSAHFLGSSQDLCRIFQILLISSKTFQMFLKIRPFHLFAFWKLYTLRVAAVTFNASKTIWSLTPFAVVVRILLLILSGELSWRNRRKEPAGAYLVEYLWIIFSLPQTGMSCQ